MRVIVKPFVVLGLVLAACASDDGGSVEGTVEDTSALNVKRIRYEERDVTAGPDGYDLWAPTGVSDREEVFGLGLACNDDFSVCAFDLLKLDARGRFSVILHDFVPGQVNRHGVAGGCVIDPDTQLGQAAIAQPNGKLKLIPRRPGEIDSCIFEFSDAETAVVFSFDEASTETDYVFRNGRSFPITLAGADIRDVNDRGQIAGILSTTSGDRAFRFDAPAQTTTVLEPVVGDPDSWGLGINQQGEVLGYSFVFGAAERIGKWNRKNKFETHFVEGTPEVPPVSDQLIWNEKDFIVISAAHDGKTYIVPKPGVRLDLADLLDCGTVPPSLYAFNINERGDFLAQSLVDASVHLFVRTD